MSNEWGLPIEVTVLIFKFLKGKDVLNIICTCKYFQEIMLKYVHKNNRLGINHAIRCGYNDYIEKWVNIDELDPFYKLTLVDTCLYTVNYIAICKIFNLDEKCNLLEFQKNVKIMYNDLVRKSYEKPSRYAFKLCNDTKDDEIEYYYIETDRITGDAEDDELPPLEE